METHASAWAWNGFLENDKTYDKVHGNAPDFAEHLSFIMAIWQCTSSPGPLFLGTRAWRNSQAHALSPPIYA